MIEPVSLTKDPKLSRGVLRAVVGDQPFRNAMLVEDSFKMIDESCDSWCLSVFVRSETCCRSQQLADIPYHFSGIAR